MYFGGWMNKLWHPDNGILFNVKKKKTTSYKAMKRHGENVNAYYQVEEADVKRLHANILEKAKLWRQWKRSEAARGYGGRWVMEEGGKRQGTPDI